MASLSDTERFIPSCCAPSRRVVSYTCNEGVVIGAPNDVFGESAAPQGRQANKKDPPGCGRSARPVRFSPDALRNVDHLSQGGARGDVTSHARHGATGRRPAEVLTIC